MYRIKQLREEKGISQRALANKIGASAKAVNFWESGKVEPSAKFILSLANVFECTADFLLGREDDLGNVNVMRELENDEKEILELFTKLDKKERAELADFARYLVSKN